MNDTIKTAWQVLMAIPTAAAWVMLAICITVAYGPEEFDKFIKHWNNMIEDREDA